MENVISVDAHCHFKAQRLVLERSAPNVEPMFTAAKIANFMIKGPITSAANPSLSEWSIKNGATYVNILN